MIPETPLAREVALLIANQLTSEEVLAFKASPEAADRAYTLIEAERERPLAEEERREMESYLLIQHIMILAKAEARRKLQQRAS